MEVSKGLEMDLLKVTCENLRNERDVLKMRVQHLTEENDKLVNAENAFNEKVESLLMKELEDIERDMGKRNVTEEDLPVLTPMYRVEHVVNIYNRLHNKGGNGIAYPTSV